MPTVGLTPFNLYVSLSQGWEHESIQLLHEFDEKIFTTHPSKFLKQEDPHLYAMDQNTKKAWAQHIAHQQVWHSFNDHLQLVF